MRKSGEILDLVKSWESRLGGFMVEEKDRVHFMVGEIDKDLAVGKKVK